MLPEAALLAVLLEEVLLVETLLLLLEGAWLTLLEEELRVAALLLLRDGALLALLDVVLLDVVLLEPTLLAFLEGACCTDRFEVLRFGLLYVWVLRVTVRLLGFSAIVLWVTVFRLGVLIVVNLWSTPFPLRALFKRVALLLLVPRLFSVLRASLRLATERLLLLALLLLVATVRLLRTALSRTATLRSFLYTCDLSLRTLL